MVVPSIQNDPTNPFPWVVLAHKMMQDLPVETREVIQNHRLSRWSRVLFTYAHQTRDRSNNRLRELARQSITPTVVASAIEEIVKQKTIAQCAHEHVSGGYYDEAEKYIGTQWNNVIWPIIQNEDFSRTVEIACGHGRNTEYIRRYASYVDLVDVNQTCLSFCRQRFGEEQDGCKFSYHLTAGDGMPSIPTQSATFVYSFDSMVHFDKIVMRDYVNEVARVLVPGGTAFLHHSNFGTFAPNSDWHENHGSRSDMTADLMRQYATDAGLRIKFQRLSGKADGWGMDDLDCFSLLEKSR